MIRSLLLVSLIASCSSNDDSRHIEDACVAGVNESTLTGPASYACHDPFKSLVTFTNNTCAPLQVTGVKIHAITTSGACTPPGDYTYAGTTVAAGDTMTVLDLTGNQFCCIAPGPCPTPLECDETYTLTVQTPAGDISKTETVHLSLGGCDTVCP